MVHDHEVVAAPDQGIHPVDAAMTARAAEQGLSWASLAKLTGMSAQSILSIRQGRSVPRPPTVRKLERALRVPKGWLTALLAGDPGNHGDREDPRQEDVMATQERLALADHIRDVDLSPADVYAVRRLVDWLTSQQDQDRPATPTDAQG